MIFKQSAMAAMFFFLHFADMFVKPQTFSANLVKISSKMNVKRGLFKKVTKTHICTWTQTWKAFHNIPTLAFGLREIKMQL